MWKTFVVSTVLILLTVPPCQGQVTIDLLADGDSLYALNEYRESIVSYSQACSTDSGNVESFWKLSRSLNLLGETTPKDSQLVIFEESKNAANHALELDEGNAEAHFQLARALGKIALFKGIFKSASLAKKVRNECRRTLEIDSLHDGAWHILGRWNREVGRKSKFLRIPMGLGAANKKDARAFMKRAIELNPDYVNHHLEMGITYMTYKDHEAAADEFEKCLQLESQRPLDEKYKEEAKKYLAELIKK